jgi:hypothetical protein
MSKRLKISVVLLLIFVLTINNAISSDDDVYDISDLTSQPTAAEETNALENTLSSGQQFTQYRTVNEAYIQANGQSIRIPAGTTLSNSAAGLSATGTIRVKDAEIENGKGIKIDNGLLIASADRVVVKNSLIAYSATNVRYDLKERVDIGTSQLVTVNHYRFPNVADSYFILNQDGSLKKANIKSSAPTDYILPNRYWSLTEEQRLAWEDSLSLRM